MNQFTPPYHIVMFIFAHNVLPKKSGKNKYRNSDLYFLDEVVHRKQECKTLDDRPLCYDIISYIHNVAKPRLGEMCFGFPRILSLIFKAYGVQLEGQ